MFVGTRPQSDAVDAATVKNLTCVDFIDGQTVELGSALFAQLHLPIEEALVSENPFIRGLALLDGRCAKRTV